MAKPTRLLVFIVLTLVLAGVALVILWMRERGAAKVAYRFEKVVFQVGDTALCVHVAQVGSNPLTMVNLHEDERTSVRAARVVQEKQGGRLIHLVHSGVRRPTFLLGGRQFDFDPNRIYSEAGANATIRVFDGGPIPPEAIATVGSYAAQFVEHFALGRQRALIALHNNEEEKYSIRSYLPGAPLEADTDQIFVNPAADVDDFYFVTDDRFFRAFQEQGFNVILQDNRIRRDDGSLSIFAGRHGIPYINVEAQNEHFEEQVRMIETAVRVIDSVIGKLDR